MRALTLFEPWATLCVVGAKQLETRSWGTPYRGPLAIHVSKKSPPEAMALCYVEPFFSTLAAAATQLGAFGWHPGCIIGIVELLACYETGDNEFGGLTDKERAFGDYSPGRFAWRLSNPRRLAVPVPCRGNRGLWTVPPEVAVALAQELKRAG